MERGLSILWIDAICGSVQNSMTPPEKKMVRRVGRAGRSRYREMLARSVQARAPAAKPLCPSRRSDISLSTHRTPGRQCAEVYDGAGKQASTECRKRGMKRRRRYLPGWDIPKASRDLFTDHFGLVSDVLAEAFTRLRDGSRAAVLMGRVHFGGALSGRDQNAVTKTVSGLLKLIQPDGNAMISDEDLEWAVRLALEVRRRVKEQQKRIRTVEF